jgi:hypothetical protein
MSEQDKSKQRRIAFTFTPADALTREQLDARGIEVDAHGIPRQPQGRVSFPTTQPAPRLDTMTEREVPIELLPQHLQDLAQIRSLQRDLARLSRAAWSVMRHWDHHCTAARAQALQPDPNDEQQMEAYLGFVQALFRLHAALGTMTHGCQCRPPGAGEAWCTGHCEQRREP